MIEFLTLFLTLLAFFFATYEDIKKKEIYDYINFLYVFSILLLGVIDSFYLESFTPIIFVGFGLLLGFLLGSLLYLAGMWGGGDAKFLIGFGASLYYLLSFINLPLNSNLQFFLQDSIKNFSSSFVDIFSFYVVLVNILVIFSLFLHLRLRKTRKVRLDILNSLLIISFLTFGIYLPIEPLFLFLWGFIGFLIFFFSSEELTQSLFLVMKKKKEHISSGDFLFSSVELESKKITIEDSKYGLNEQQVELIKKSNKKTILVKTFFPLGALFTLNFLMYGILILSLEIMNVKMILFLLIYLLFSFLIGGLMGIFYILYLFFKSTQQSKILGTKGNKKISFFKPFQKKLFYIVQLLLLFSFLGIQFFYLYLLSMLYFLVIIIKKLEKTLFVLKKNIKDIVPGDWIVQDILIKKKLYFKKEDFSLGVDEFQLKKIQELSKKYNVMWFYVKEGIAFMPPLFLAFIIMLFYL